MGDILIKGMEMPKSCCECAIKSWDGEDDVCPFSGISALSIGRQDDCPLVPVPPHGDLIDRDALIKDGWSNLHKEVIRMGGYAIHELPLKNPSIPVIIPAEEGE